MLVPPPGAGVNTVTDAVPALAISATNICAFSCVPLTKVVTRSVPFQRTIELLAKLVPVTVSVKDVKPVLPAVAPAGERLVKVGTVLLIVNDCAAEIPPPDTGVATLTETIPAVAMSVAVICAVS